jgi:hypothetical protein
MLNYFKKTTSIKNLGSHHLKGQIATLLMLFMVAIIFFILATVNIGSTSLTVLKVSNATDSAGLQLGSALATYAHQMYQSLGGTYEKCTKKGGLLGAVIAVIVVIICIIFPPAFLIAAYAEGALAFTAACAAIGAVAGGISMGIATGTWSGALQGAIQGASVGAAIGGAFYAFSPHQIVTKEITSQATIETASPTIDTGTIGSGGGGGTVINAGTAEEMVVLEPYTVTATSVQLPALSTTVSPVTANFAAGMAITTGNMVAAGLAASSTLYVEYVKDVAISDGIMRAIRQMIPDDYVSLRESVFYTALSQVVEDRTRVPDYDDIDADGDNTEMIPKFEQWFYNRIESLSGRSFITEISNLVNTLDSNVLWYNGSPSKNPNSIKEFLNQLSRQEVECDSCCSGVNPGVTGINCPEGQVTELVRDLYSCSSRFSIDFYIPGHPTKAELASWYLCDTDCSSPADFDEIDAVHKAYEEHVDTVQELKDRADEDINSLDSNRDWVSQLYNASNPKDTGTLYGSLGYIWNGQSGGIKGIKYWAQRVNAIRNNDLKKCQVAYGNFYPDRLSEDYTALCGAPYDPSQDSTNPFYPCPWKKEIFNLPATGTFVPDYPCRINAAERQDLTLQASTLANRSLDWYSEWQKSVPEAKDTPCAPGQLVAGSVGTEVKVTSMRFEGDRKAPCDSGSAQRDGNLIFAHQWKTTWTCVNGDPPVYSNLSKEGSGEIVMAASGVRDIAEVKEVNLADLSGPSDTVPDVFQRRVAGELMTDIEGITIPSDGPFATTDADLNDEFTPVLASLKGQENTINNIRSAISHFADALKTFESNPVNVKPTNGSGSAGPYEWTDSEGNGYAAKVTSGPFVFPSMTTYKKGNWLLNKTCTKLVNYCDNIDSGCPDNNHRTWISVTKEEAANVAVKSSRMNLGLWNPFAGSNKRTVTKKAYVVFSPDKVGVK